MKSLKELLGFKSDYSYSSMRRNGLNQRVFFNGIKCIWGLREKGKPSILIHPRPVIRLKAINGEDGKHIINFKENDVVLYDEDFDFVMQRCIEREKPEDIIKAMFDNTIVFEYNDVKQKL